MVGRMGADTTAIKKVRNKSNEHDNYSRKIVVLEKETGGKMFVRTYRHFPNQ